MAREQSSSVSSAAPAAASRNGMAARLNGRAETVPSAPLAATAATSRKAWPLSFSQQRLWLLEQLEPGTALYNIPTAVRITGHLDVKALARAFNSLITRHEALRARFDSSEEEPRQIVEPEAGIDLPVVALRETSTEAKERELASLIRQEVNRPFDLNICPLLRAVLFRSSDTEHVLVTTIHHLVADEWSVRIIFNELGKLYAAHAKNEPVVMPAPGIQYADYAVWQRGALQGEALERQLSFWKQTLAGSPPLLELTPGHPRGLKPTFNGAVIRRSLGKDLLDEMKQLARKERATPFMVLLAAFQSLTHRYTGQDDLVIATPQAGRNQVETEGVVGFFVNTLLLRVSLQGNPTFREILERARRATLAAFEHQETPLQKIVEVAQPERSTHHLPFTRLMFLTQTSLMEKMRWADLDAEFLDVATDTAKFDLTFGLQETSEGLIARAEFNTDLFPRETVEKLLEHFEILLRGAVRQPDARVSELPLLSEAERQRILFEGNLTAATYPRDCAVHEIFQRQARSQPGGAALRFGDRVLSYAELNERANQLARHLARSESARGGHIAFCLPPSPEMIIAMLGILKAGAAYVPLDPGYPPERLRFMLEDSAAAALITEERLLSVFGGTRAKTICLDRDRASIEAESGADPEIPIRGGDAAYLMYTSGSTGVPKGVVVPHRAISRLVLNTNYISFRSDDRVAQVSNVSFDAATFEVWGALLNGACLVGIPTETLLSPRDFARELRDLKITTMFLTSAVFNQIAAEAPDAFSRLRTLIAGGEALDAASVRAVLNTSPPARLLNGYGPTENTTFTCWHEIGEVKPGQSSVPIGKPVSNTQVYILDRYLNPVPPGAPGELYAAGDGLAIGYWNSPELNRERFIPNPFGGHEQERLYKTGDLARRLPSGEIEFLGRVDNQVKLRGFRIELGEVEAALKEHPSVRECVVKIFGGAADKKRLAAYLSPRDGQTADSAALRDFLRGRLPEYMIPSSFTVLDALPLTQNGKVDRAALPEPDQIRLGKERVSPPRDDVELKLARIWEAVLGVSPIGIQDRFFDLGGHSLLAVRVISQTEKVFGRKLKLATIFQAQTIAELAAVLREEIKESAVVHSSSVVQIQPRGSRTPLFLVHGAGGGMFWGYMNLSRHLGLDQPVFAIRSRALDGRDEFETIEEMAESYIKDLKTVQPSGPYLLGGYCFGGNVAYEMARLLEKRGEKSLLLLLNAAPPNSSYTNFRMTAGWWGRFAKNLLYWGNYVRHWTPSQRREFFRWKRERFAAKLGLLRRPASAASKVDVGDMVDLSLFSPEERKAWEAHIRALLLYHPGKFQGAVNLIRSPGHPMWCSFSPDYGWGPLAKGGVQVTIVPGAHEKILEEPCVKTVAAELQKFLEGARELSAEQIVSKPQNTVAPEAVEPPTRADALEFWQKQLAGAPALLELPTDFNRPAVQSGSISAKSFRLPASFSARLKSFAKAAGTATEIPLIASVAILLRRYSRQEDFVMGFENSSRASSASPGETVSTPQPPLVLRQRVNGSAVTRDLLAGLNEQFAEAEKHRLFSVKELMDLLDPTEDASYQPIFQVLLSTGDAHSHRETSRFDLEFHVIRSDETLELEILYSRDLFEEATVARMLRHWETLLGGILERPERNVSELPILPPEEQKLLLEDWTATDREYPRDQTLATLIFEQAQRSPDAIAIVDGTIRLTYGEMHRRAVALAASLRSLGVGQETLVGICVHRSWRMIVGILGTLYAGGAYVPLDPAYPQDRLKYILEDARAEVLITEEKLRSLLGEITAKVLCIDSLDLDASTVQDTTVGANTAPHSLAYVIYTSGSTGKPKGVAIEHRNAVALIYWAKGVFQPEELDGMLASTSICFDLSVFEMFVPLALGGKIVLAENALALPSLPAASEVRSINTVPSAIRELVRIKGIPDSVRVVNLAGEPLPTSLVDQIYSGSNTRCVYDLYGPTETTTYSTFTLREPGKKATIGRPLDNEQVYILDENRQPAPIGVPGELFIGGNGVARGYLNQPELTAERFLENPFRPGGRCYRTGDLARWLPSGQIEYLGRLDHQVKIRGFRIELGEVEAVLKRQSSVRDAVVMAREDLPGQRRLVAYIVLDGNAPRAVEELRVSLREKLPEYMVPSAFVFLPELPLTPNGKINRKTLPAPEPDRAGSASEWVAPLSDGEKQLAGIWEEVLRVKEVGIRDNFFDLGGNSLLAIQVISRIREQLQVELPLSAIFDTPSIETLARQLAALAPADNPQKAPALRRADRSAPIPASYVQERLWFLDQLIPDSDAYNVPAAIRIQGPLEPERLEKACNEIVARHEALRTTFAYHNGSVTQVIAAELRLNVEFNDLGNAPEADRETRARALANELAHKPFDLAKGPLIRAGLTRVSPRDHIFTVVLHHTVSDGWSLGLFFRELQALYQKDSDAAAHSNLPNIEFQYADVMLWKRELLESGSLGVELGYWKQKLAEAPPQIDLPADPIDTRANSGAARKSILIAKATRERREAGAAENSSLFMHLVAALALTLHKWTGQEDMVIGTVAAGRSRREFENLIGCFMNFLPIRVRLRASEPARRLVAEVRQTVLEAQEHEECPFEKLVETINPERKLDTNPLYNVALLLQNFAVEAFHTENLQSVPYPVEMQSPLLDLRFEAEETEAGLAVRCEYKKSLFEGATIDRLLEAFRESLEMLAALPEKPLKDYSLKAFDSPRASAESKPRQKNTLAIAATFTAEPVNDPLRYWIKELELRAGIEFAPYNQVFQQLLDPAGALGRNASGMNVVLVRFEDWGRAGQDHNGAGQEIDRDKIRANARQFLAALKTAAGRSSVPWLVCICPPSPNFRTAAGAAEFLSSLEELITSSLATAPGVYLLSSREMRDWYPVENYYDAAGDDLGHVPYTPVFFTALATGIIRKYHALKRAPHKVIVLDCDNTLWSGVCAEDGPKGVRLEAGFSALQNFMRSQHEAGMLLCLCSKNNEADVREVFAQRIEMPLRREHIAARRLNWKPKSENLKSLARELKLGLDSFIFIDDNPVECAEVSANCPDVLTLQLPDDPAAFENFFRHCWVFDHLKLTEEDRKRAEMYQQNRQREQLREESLSLADFVAGLELRVVIEPMQPAQLQRTAQLTQRTNQFNFTTRRRAEMDIQKLLTSHEVLTVTVADRFGDYGLTGAIICSQREGTLDVDTFLLSCRVLGRGVEHQMMARLGEIAQSRKLNWVDAHFVPTQRNQPALDFLESIGAPFRQPSNGGYLFRFPAGFAAEVTFNPQPAEEAHPSPEKAVNSIAENGGDGKAPLSNRSSQPATALSGSNTAAAQPLLSGFRRCREIALNACDAGRIHQQVESRAEKRAGNRSTYVAPSNDTERQLCELWQKLLHVERVGVRDNFFELGGHSLLAVRLFAEIEKLTGRKLPLVTLFQSSTIRQLARALRKDAGEVSRGLLVPLQPNGTRPPLFLVHGAGGDVLWGYANLSAHMPADQPLFGIRSRGQTGQDEFQSIEEMAACYIKEIRGAQPQGPYHLGGYCFGGNVAYEMARQLKAQGQEVALVALLDSAPSNVGYESIQWWSPKFHLRFARNLIYWLTDFARLDTREQRRWVCRKLRAAGRKAWRLVRREEPEFFVDLEDVIDPEHFPQNELKLWQAHLEALVRHIEQPYSGEVVLLRTRGQPIFCSLEEDFCWGKLAGRLRLKRIPGSHENIFMEPNVKRLARELCACLEETRAQGARAESSLLVSKPS